MQKRLRAFYSHTSSTFAKSKCEMENITHLFKTKPKTFNNSRYWKTTRKEFKAKFNIFQVHRNFRCFVMRVNVFVFFFFPCVNRFSKPHYQCLFRIGLVLQKINKDFNVLSLKIQCFCIITIFF